MQIRIVHGSALMYPVGLQLMIDQIVFRLATFAANVALGPSFRRGPIRMDVFHVLSQIAWGRIASTAVTAHGPSVVVA